MYVIKDTLLALQWKILPHAAYSPVLLQIITYSIASCRPALKIRSKKRRNKMKNEEIKKWLDEWIALKDEHFFFNRGIHLLLLPKK